MTCTLYQTRASRPEALQQCLERGDGVEVGARLVGTAVAEAEAAVVEYED